MRDAGSGIRDPGSGMLDAGRGTREITKLSISGVWVKNINLEIWSTLQSPPLAGVLVSLNFGLLTVGVEYSFLDNSIFDRSQGFHPHAYFAFVKIVIYPRQRGRLDRLPSDINYPQISRTFTGQH